MSEVNWTYRCECCGEIVKLGGTLERWTTCRACGNPKEGT